MIRHVRRRSVVGQCSTSRAPRGAGVARYFLDIRLFWVVTSFKSSVITCPFMANVTQSEP